MKNNKGFTLIELLAVIVVLAIVMVLAITTVLPLMEQSTEAAFRVEATNTIKKADEALTMYNLQQIKLNEDSTQSCKSSDGKKMCFTVAELVNLQLYEIDTDTFKGKVDINLTNSKNPVYTLYFKKNAEFVLAEEEFKDYSKNGTLKLLSEWSDSYESCSCN